MNDTDTERKQDEDERIRLATDSIVARLRDMDWRDMAQETDTFCVNVATVYAMHRFMTEGVPESIPEGNEHEAQDAWATFLLEALVGNICHYMPNAMPNKKELH